MPAVLRRAVMLLDELWRRSGGTLAEIAPAAVRRLIRAQLEHVKSWEDSRNPVPPRPGGADRPADPGAARGPSFDGPDPGRRRAARLRGGRRARRSPGCGCARGRPSDCGRRAARARPAAPVRGAAGPPCAAPGRHRSRPAARCSSGLPKPEWTEDGGDRRAEVGRRGGGTSTTGGRGPAGGAKRHARSRSTVHPARRWAS